MQMLKRYWPALLAILFLVLTTFAVVEFSRQSNEGHFVYALDDPYIHMAMARNFSRYGVWGINRHEFSSSTSAPLWTLLLAAAYLISDSIYLPLFLNVVCAIALLLLADRLIAQFEIKAVVRLVTLIAVLIFTPTVPLIMSGMEHTLQALLSIAFVFYAAKVIAEDAKPVGQKPFVLLLLLTLTLPLVRFELLAFVLIAVVVLTMRKRFARAIALAVSAGLPVLFYAIISLRNDSLWLPNSVLLKVSTPASGLGEFSERVFQKSVAAPHLPALFVIAVLLYFWLPKADSRTSDQRVLLLLFLCAGILLHLMFGDVGWFFRYEAYLVALATVIIAPLLRELLLQRRFATLPTLIMLLCVATTTWLAFRGVKSVVLTPQAATNIYQQQVQMASFVRTYYSGAAVAANDIGALSYAGSARLLDLWGLGSARVTMAKLDGKYTSAQMAELAHEHETEIALLYSSWFEAEGGIPSHWQRAGELTTPNCFVCGNPTVTFYAVRPEALSTLKRNLKEFSTRLPAGVSYREWP